MENNFLLLYLLGMFVIAVATLVTLFSVGRYFLKTSDDTITDKSDQNLERRQSITISFFVSISVVFLLFVTGTLFFERRFETDTSDSSLQWIISADSLVIILLGTIGGLVRSLYEIYQNVKQGSFEHQKTIAALLTNTVFGASVAWIWYLLSEIGNSMEISATLAFLAGFAGTAIVISAIRSQGLEVERDLWVKSILEEDRDNQSLEENLKKTQLERDRLRIQIEMLETKLETLGAQRFENQANEQDADLPESGSNT